MISTEVHAHRLICVGPRRTLGSHHVNSAIHEFFEIEISTTVGSSKIEADKCAEQPGHKDAKSVTADGNFEK